MKSTTSALAIALFASLARADYGHQFSNALSTGPTADDSWIREANTTLILPAINSPQTGNLALWPGMGTSDGDLIQGLAISSTEEGSTGCTQTEGVWCIVASTLESSQEMGDYVAAEPGSYVTFHYKFNDNTSQYDQTVSLNGTVVSKLSTTSGHAQGWGTAIECQQTACGYIAGHKYINTKLILDVADASYDQTKGTTNATGDMVTTDSGKTWTIDTIVVGSYTYT